MNRSNGCGILLALVALIGALPMPGTAHAAICPSGSVLWGCAEGEVTLDELLGGQATVTQVGQNPPQCRPGCILASVEISEQTTTVSTEGESDQTCFHLDFECSPAPAVTRSPSTGVTVCETCGQK